MSPVRLLQVTKLCREHTGTSPQSTVVCDFTEQLSENAKGEGGVSQCVLCRMNILTKEKHNRKTWVRKLEGHECGELNERSFNCSRRIKKKKTLQGRIKYSSRIDHLHLTYT